VLLAITFAAADPGPVNEAGGTSLSIFTTFMSEGWAETVILISFIGQLFCGMACVTSCSRTFYAFSRDRAVPGWRFWTRLNARHVPIWSILGSCLFALLITLPALSGDSTGFPVAFFAVVSIAVIGLYIAYVAPVYLRLRAGDRFTPGAWNLGPKYKWMCTLATVWVLLCTVYFCLPFTNTAVPWNDEFTWSALNYAPIMVFGTLLVTGLWWVLGAKNHYTGPVRTIDELEAELAPSGEAPTTTAT